MKFEKGDNLGLKNPRYNYGLTFCKTLNRWKIFCRDWTYVHFYRAVMECELKRPLNKNEHVHHINGNPNDDRIGNLMIVTPSEHRKFHQIKSKRKVICINTQKVYESISLAARDTKSDRNHIRKVCNGIGKSVKGNFWSYIK